MHHAVLPILVTRAGTITAEWRAAHSHASCMSVEIYMRQWMPFDLWTFDRAVNIDRTDCEWFFHLWLSLLAYTPWYEKRILIDHAHKLTQINKTFLTIAMKLSAHSNRKIRLSMLYSISSMLLLMFANNILCVFPMNCAFGSLCCVEIS